MTLLQFVAFYWLGEACWQQMSDSPGLSLCFHTLSVGAFIASLFHDYMGGSKE